MLGEILCLYQARMRGSFSETRPSGEVPSGWCLEWLFSYVAGLEASNCIFGPGFLLGLQWGLLRRGRIARSVPSPPQGRDEVQFVRDWTLRQIPSGLMFGPVVLLARDSRLAHGTQTPQGWVPSSSRGCYCWPGGIQLHARCRPPAGSPRRGLNTPSDPSPPQGYDEAQFLRDSE